MDKRIIRMEPSLCSKECLEPTKLRAPVTRSRSVLTAVEGHANELCQTLKVVMVQHLLPLHHVLCECIRVYLGLTYVAD